MYKKKGLTILELIIAVTLLAIVMVLGYKIWTGLNKDYQMQSDITKSQGDARNAVSEMVNKLKRADTKGAGSSIDVHGNVLTITTVNTTDATTPGINSTTNAGTFTYKEITDPTEPSKYVLVEQDASSTTPKVLVKNLVANTGFQVAGYKIADGDATHTFTKVDDFTIKDDDPSTTTIDENDHELKKISFTIKINGSTQDFVGDYSRRSIITN